MKTGFTQYDKTAGDDTWFTPKQILFGLGHFDLDPCTVSFRPFDVAQKHFEHDKGVDGLALDWQGARVFCNPPYGRQTSAWMKRMAEHKNGIALIFARTETSSFFPHVWEKASGVLFLRRRISFINRQGEVRGNAGCPSCLVSFDG